MKSCWSIDEFWYGCAGGPPDQAETLEELFKGHGVEVDELLKN